MSSSNDAQQPRASTAERRDWARRFEAELTENILPFWMRQAVDSVNGGFYGAVTNDLRVLNDVPRSAVLCARILWAFSTAQRVMPGDGYRQMAGRAYDYLTQRFWDHEYGGVYWMVDRHGQPVNDRKHVYAQGFAIYALAEYYRATKTADSLERAKQLFALVQAHTYDRVHQGHIEGCGRAWDQLADMRLSDKEPDCRKSMNTLLHLMEAYTNLARVWPSAETIAALRGLVQVFLEHVIDTRGRHLRLFFDDAWHQLAGAATYGHEISFGHDIEATWLLVEAAEVLGDAALIEQARSAAVRIAEAVCAEGQTAEGRLRSAPAGQRSEETEWWVPAEAVVGFYGAYQISSDPRFLDAARSNWAFIQAKLVDRVHGDWFKRLDGTGAPDPTSHKIGPWECPYHHSRCCFEMIERLGS